MRKVAMLVGVSLLAACGGGGEQSGDAAPPAAPPVTPTAGATHDVNMVLEGTAYLYVPAQLTIAVGDKVNFHNVSGGPHNVSFWPDSIPAGAMEPLAAGMPNQDLGPLGGGLLVDPMAVFTVTFANVPVGAYRFYCLPHLANNMVGVITVQ